MIKLQLLSNDSKIGNTLYFDDNSKTKKRYPPKLCSVAIRTVFCETILNHFQLMINRSAHVSMCRVFSFLKMQINCKLPMQSFLVVFRSAECYFRLTWRVLCEFALKTAMYFPWLKFYRQSYFNTFWVVWYDNRQKHTIYSQAVQLIGHRTTMVFAEIKYI